MKRSIELVPAWFGMEPDDLKDELVRTLRSVGAQILSDSADSAELRLSAAAASCLRHHAQMERNLVKIEEVRRALAQSRSVLDRSQHFAIEMRRAIMAARAA